ncbi:hypothetical protein [Glycomyces sp. NRRL B-16210]|uniref:hypothetical protein n=1 Tax=Glycomyces sp. NRRL B-16210 TaxID=1463821 RepID=UPI0005563824|nr:hypothetical protein [Glycomyces sp. NRRL B-16210]
MGIEILAQEFGPERDQALAGPFGLFVTVFLVVVTIFLIRGMNKHVKRLNNRLESEAALAAAASTTAPAAADAAETKDGPATDDATRA